MHTSLGSPPGKHSPQAAGKRRSGSCPGLRHLRSLSPSRLQPTSSWHGSMPSVRSARPRLACHPSLARGAACRPATSTPTVNGWSDYLSDPARPCPEHHADQAFPSSPGKFEPVPLSAPRRKPPAAAQECCRAQDTPRNMQRHTVRRPGRQSAAGSTSPSESADESKQQPIGTITDLPFPPSTVSGNLFYFFFMRDPCSLGCVKSKKQHLIVPSRGCGVKRL